MKNLKRTGFSLTIFLVIGFLACVGAGSQRELTPDEMYTQAMEHLKQARSLLRDYVSKGQTGDRAYYANIQLKALQGLVVDDTPYAPVVLDGNVMWRIVSMEPNETSTKVVIELINSSEQSQSSFRWFVGRPLELMANGKRYSQKKDTTVEPQWAEFFDHSYKKEYLRMSPSQKGNLTLFFEPFDSGVTTGQIEYADNGQNSALHFNLLNKTLRPSGN